MNTNTTACYRLRPYFRNVGAGCTALVATIGLASVWLAHFNVDNSFPNPQLAATFFGIAWAFFVLLGAWLLLLHRQYRLFLSTGSLRQCGVLSDRTMELSAVRKLAWRRYPEGGSVRLSSDAASLTVDLGNFLSTERQEVIAFMRASLPSERQFGWEAFSRQYQDGPERRARSQRATRMALWVTAITAGAAFALWLVRGNGGHLLLSLANAAAFIYLRRKETTARGEQKNGEQSLAAESR